VQLIYTNNTGSTESLKEKRLLYALGAAPGEARSEEENVPPSSETKEGKEVNEKDIDRSTEEAAQEGQAEGEKALREVAGLRFANEIDIYAAYLRGSRNENPSMFKINDYYRQLSPEGKKAAARIVQRANEKLKQAGTTYSIKFEDDGLRFDDGWSKEKAQTFLQDEKAMDETIQSLDSYNDSAEQQENLYILERAIGISVHQLLGDLQKNGKDSPLVQQTTKEIQKILQKVDQRDRALGTRLLYEINDQIIDSNHTFITDPKLWKLELVDRAPMGPEWQVAFGVPVARINPRDRSPRRQRTIDRMYDRLKKQVNTLIQSLKDAGPNAVDTKILIQGLHKGLQRVNAKDRALATGLFQSINGQLRPSDYRLITNAKLVYLQIEGRS